MNRAVGGEAGHRMEEMTSTEAPDAGAALAWVANPAAATPARGVLLMKMRRQRRSEARYK